MADECVLGTPGISVIKYDLKCYLQYAELLKDMKEKLNEEGEEANHSVFALEFDSPLAYDL